VNDRYRCGAIEVNGSDDKTIVQALIDAAYLKPDALDCIDIDGDEDTLFLEDSQTGEPVFQLERLDHDD
jgi:hypothetical protein